MEGELTRDPTAGQQTAPQTANPYTYVRNNPTSRVGPTGMSDSELVGPLSILLTAEGDPTGDYLFRGFECFEQVAFSIAFAALAIAILVVGFEAGPIAAAALAPAGFGLLFVDFFIGRLAYATCTGQHNSGSHA